MIDIGLKAPDRATALQLLVSAELLTIVTATKDTPEQLFWAPGVDYDDTDLAVIIKPAVYDKAGALVTPAELDPSYHANVRLSGPDADKLAARLEKGGTVRNSLTLAKASDDTTATTKSISNRTISGVTLFRLRGDGVKTPVREWL